MNLNSKDVWLGAGIVGFGVFLLVYAIPVFVSSPSNVRALVLAPTFWPVIVAWLIVILGVTLVLSRLFVTPALPTLETPAATMGRDELMFATARLAAAAVVMLALVLATPSLGLVLTTGLAFAAISAIVATPRPVTALITAIVLPLLLYAFFAHVAGVSIPQGRFLSLP